MKALFTIGFFAVSVIAVAMMALGMCENPTAPAVASNLTAEEENALLSQVEFSLGGAPAGEVALFLDATMITRLVVGETTRLSLVGNERCGVSLQIRGTDGEWVHVSSLGCINHAPYAAISFEASQYEVKTSYGAW